MTGDLFVTAYTPVLGSGRALRSFGVLAAMARHRPVEVLYTPFGADAPAPEIAALDGVTLTAVEPSRGLRRLAAVAGARLGSVPLDIARAVSPELAAAVTDRAPQGRVVADGPTVAATLWRYAGSHEVIHLAHNVESALQGEAYEGFEIGVLEVFSESWLPTAADVEAARRLAPRGGELRVVPNVVALPPEPRRAPEPGRVLLVADFTYAPNREGLHFLVGEVLPHVPEASLVVAGRGLDGTLAEGGYVALGFVEDLAAEYARAAVVAVPMLRGGGSPLKLAEGMAHAVPVVATAHAAGLLDGAVPGEHLLAAADGASFAAQLAAVLRGEHPQLGSAGRSLVAEHFSIDALARVIAP